MSDAEESESEFDPGEFDTQAEGAPDSFAIGFFKLNDLDCFPGTFCYNMIKAAKLPPSSPRRYLEVS
jgi:hypothetical protein